jgi:hypothetical protein
MAGHHHRVAIDHRQRPIDGLDHPAQRSAGKA